MEKSRKPKIRFKGFSDDWEQRELEEVAKYRNGKAHENCIDDNGKYIVVNSKFVSTDGGVKKFSNLQNEPLFKNEIAFVLSDVPNGRALARTFLIEKADKYTLNQRIAGITPLSGIYPYYLYILMNRHPYFLAFDDGAKQTNLSVSDVMEFESYYPIYDEQKKIGECFHSIDKLITLHQRKLEKLMNVKKSMLEKMFPKQGSKVPEIRFNGFTDDWEQRELGELASSFEYGLNAASKSYDGINKYIRITDIDDETRTFLDTDLTSPDCDLSLSENYLLKDGDILFARTGASVGKTFIYKAFNGVVYYAGFLIRARLKENCSPQFVFYNTLTKEYERFIRVTSQRSGQPGVNAHEYATFELLLPKHDEQCEIGNFFTNLDHLITLHQRKLEKLKNIKKSMLEKMFI